MFKLLSYIRTGSVSALQLGGVWHISGIGVLERRVSLLLPDSSSLPTLAPCWQGMQLVPLRSLHGLSLCLKHTPHPISAPHLLFPQVIFKSWSCYLFSEAFLTILSILQPQLYPPNPSLCFLFYHST